MGNILDYCSKNITVIPESDLRVQVLIRSGKGLKNADTIGTSDPYCLCRVGLLNTKWDDKSEKTQRQSPPILETTNPEWNFATAYYIPKTMETVKQHSNIIPRALTGAIAGSAISYGYTKDPSLALVGATSMAITTVAAGSVYDKTKTSSKKNATAISINDLELHIKILDNDIFSGDDLLGEVAIPISVLMENENIAQEYNLHKGPGSIIVMIGPDVVSVTMNQIQSQLQGNMTKMWINSFQQYISHLDDDIMYNTNMVSFLAAGLNGDSGLRKWFLKRSNGTGEWNGPEDSNCITYSHYGDVYEKLKNLPTDIGTNNLNGSVEKNNNLGFQKLNTVMWPELPEGNRCIGLGQTQENHAVTREILDKLLGINGNWTTQQIQEYAKEFFNLKHSFNTSDFKVWTTIILHKIHFNLDITWDEGAEFMDMQQKILVSIAPGDNIMKYSAVKSALDVTNILKQKATWIEKYKVALFNLLPDDLNKLTPEQITMVTSNIMDSLLFAGGQSVPTVISYCITLLYSKWLEDSLPEFTLSTKNLYQYIMEVIRFFPPVSGFVYKKRSMGSVPSTNIYLNIHMAQCDKKVWGDDAYKFVLRPLSTYRDLMMAWANPSVGINEHKNNSRVCPAMDLSIVMVVELMKEFIRTTAPGYSGINGGVEFDKTKWLSDIKPENVKINNYSITSINLSQNRTGYPISTNQIEHLWFDGNNDKFDKIDGHTKLFIALVQAVIDPSYQAKSDHVNVMLPKQKLKVEYEIGNTGLLLTSHDEDDEESALVSLLKSIAFYVTKNFSFKDKLVWFDSKEEGILAMRNDFSHILPHQYNYWDDISSDHAIKVMCFYGVGQMLVKNYNTSANKGPDGSAYEVDMEYLSKYDTRDKFIRYGNIAYFDNNKDLIGIWSCDKSSLILPNDELWEHVKFAFRCTLVTDMTLKHHLANVHLIISNKLMFAAREACGKDHPLRRLLKAHYYRTAAINWSAKEILLPINQLAHRTWGFTADAWQLLFNDIFNSWEYKPLPQMLNEINLDCKNDLPLYEDGMNLWNVIKKYVTNYLTSKISSDENVLIQDPDIVDFWNHFNSSFNYGLPPLSFENLIDHITNSIWWCTAGHEMAGSIVEYLVHPDGLMPKICPNKTIADAQTFAQALIIIALTGIRQPALVNNWDHLFEDDECVREFQKDLISLSEHIDVLNTKREIAYNVMNPKVLESSVSI